MKKEREIQEIWFKNAVFQADAPLEKDNKKEKFMVTVPHLNILANLEIEDAFNISKSDFSARVEKMKGKNILFPFPFIFSQKMLSVKIIKKKFFFFLKKISLGVSR